MEEMIRQRESEEIGKLIVPLRGRQVVRTPSGSLSGS